MNPAKMDMVRYWKTSSAIQAKLTADKDGVQIMFLEGEKYPFPGFPRGYLLFGRLSKLKHEIKNQIFNDSWAKLEGGMSEEEVAKEIKVILLNIFKLFEESKYDIIPPNKMCLSVREIHRAWTKIAPEPKSLICRDILCHILQEDDSYRFRLEWLIAYFNPRWFRWFWGNPILLFDKALAILEQAEVIDDMKERQRLFRRIVGAILKDKQFKEKFLAICKEMDWNKLKMSKGDKYYFRGKYFKVDYDKFEY